MCKLSKLFKSGAEQPSCSNIFKDGIIPQLFQGGVYVGPTGHRIKREMLNIPLVDDPLLWICPIPNTNSMDPVFDAGHHNLYIKGWTKADQRAIVEFIAMEYTNGQGNIVVYRPTPQAYNLIVHRLSRITADVDGRWWWFKGDNNATEDPKPVQDEAIEYIYAGTLC